MRRLCKERKRQKVHLQQKTRDGFAAQVKAFATAHEGYDEPDILSGTRTGPKGDDGVPLTPSAAGACPVSFASLTVTTNTVLNMQVDPDIGAVVVGWDPHFSYSRLVYAATCLR